MLLFARIDWVRGLVAPSLPPFAFTVWVRRTMFRMARTAPALWHIASAWSRTSLETSWATPSPAPSTRRCAGVAWCREPRSGTCSAGTWAMTTLLALFAPCSRWEGRGSRAEVPAPGRRRSGLAPRGLHDPDFHSLWSLWSLWSQLGIDGANPAQCCGWGRPATSINSPG